MRYLIVIGLVLVLAAESPVTAGTVKKSGWPATLTASLARDKAWLVLGHYREQNWFSSPEVTSEIDDRDFFLHPDGKTDPEQELQATLDALFHKADTQDPDQHAQCRFPARYHWLREQLEKHDQALPVPVSCPELAQWFDTLSIGSLTLVFPAAYLNSPSSMFGHTFLRLDRAGQDNDLIAQTINYAANAEAMDNQISYAWKGLFGGYPGIVTVQPYYDKVREYSDIEHRDIWEYRLRLDPNEIVQLLRHVWELNTQSRFDYFFLDENCAYRLLTLLEVARPSLDLASQFSRVAIPSDTVRAVASAGLIEASHYRESAVTHLKTQLEQLQADEQQLAFQLASVDAETFDQHSVQLEKHPPGRQAAILETAYDYLRYRSVSGRMARTPAIADRSLTLLRMRSNLSQASGLLAPETPAVRPEQGHETRLFEMGYGQRDERGFVSLRYRPTYHGLTDPTDGYQRGASIRLLDTQLRLYNRGVIRLESLELLGITSLSGRDLFFQPLSWQLSTGLKRKLFDDQRFMVAYFEGGAGLTYPVPGGSLSLMLQPHLEVSGNFESDYSTGLSLGINYLYQGLGGQGEAGFRHGGYWLGDEHVSSSIWLNHVINLGDSNALDLKLLREKSKGEYDTEITLGIKTFF